MSVVPINDENASRLNRPPEPPSIGSSSSSSESFRNCLRRLVTLVNDFSKSSMSLETLSPKPVPSWDLQAPKCRQNSDVSFKIMFEFCLSSANVLINSAPVDSWPNISSSGSSLIVKPFSSKSLAVRSSSNCFLCFNFRALLKANCRSKSSSSTFIFARSSSSITTP